MRSTCLEQQLEEEFQRSNFKQVISFKRRSPSFATGGQWRALWNQLHMDHQQQWSPPSAIQP